jgi:3-oxoacyl-(acyl-carrier-protein) synthase
MHRVAVTGIGVICALGRTTEEFGRALRQGRSGIGPIQSADCSNLRFRNGAEVPEYDHRPYFDDKRAVLFDVSVRRIQEQRDRFSGALVLGAVQLAGLERAGEALERQLGFVGPVRLRLLATRCGSRWVRDV